MRYFIYACFVELGAMLLYTFIVCRISCMLLYNLSGLFLNYFGDAMVWRACSNGRAICKDQGSSQTYDQRSFSSVKSCAMCSNKLAQSYLRHK